MTCHTLTATCCDLRDPDWGDPRFPQCVLLLIHPPMAILFGRCLICISSMAFAGDSTQAAIGIKLKSRMLSICPVFVRFLFLCLFCLFSFLVLLVVFCFLSWFPVFAMCLRHLDSSMDYVQVRYALFCCALTETFLHESTNSFPASTNLWNDLAKAMKALDGKKNLLIATFIWRSVAFLFMSSTLLGLP